MRKFLLMTNLWENITMSRSIRLSFLVHLELYLGSLIRRIEGSLDLLYSGEKCCVGGKECLSFRPTYSIRVDVVGDFSRLKISLWGNGLLGLANFNSSCGFTSPDHFVASRTCWFTLTNRTFLVIEERRTILSWNGAVVVKHEFSILCHLWSRAPDCALLLSTTLLVEPGLTLLYDWTSCSEAPCYLEFGELLLNSS